MSRDREGEERKALPSADDDEGSAEAVLLERSILVAVAFVFGLQFPEDALAEDAFAFAVDEDDFLPVAEFVFFHGAAENVELVFQDVVGRHACRGFEEGGGMQVDFHYVGSGVFGRRGRGGGVDPAFFGDGLLQFLFVDVFEDDALLFLQGPEEGDGGEPAVAGVGACAAKGRRADADFRFDGRARRGGAFLEEDGLDAHGMYPVGYFLEGALPEGYGGAGGAVAGGDAGVFPVLAEGGRVEAGLAGVVGEEKLEARGGEVGIVVGHDDEEHLVGRLDGDGRGSGGLPAAG